MKAFGFPPHLTVYGITVQGAIIKRMDTQQNDNGKGVWHSYSLSPVQHIHRAHQEDRSKDGDGIAIRGRRISNTLTTLPSLNVPPSICGLRLIESEPPQTSLVCIRMSKRQTLWWQASSPYWETLRLKPSIWSNSHPTATLEEGGDGKHRSGETDKDLNRQSGFHLHEAKAITYTGMVNSNV